MLVGSGILYCWLVVVGMAGCDNGPLLGPCGHSKLHPPPQACCVDFNDIILHYCVFPLTFMSNLKMA